MIPASVMGGHATVVHCSQTIANAARNRPLCLLSWGQLSWAEEVLVQLHASAGGERYVMAASGISMMTVVPTPGVLSR